MEDIKQICYDNIKHLYNRFDLPESNRVFVDWAEVTGTSVQLCNSFCITRRSEMRKWVRYIQDYDLCPINIKERTENSLIREWEAHNLLYMLGYEVDRTMHVDFDIEPLLHRMAYVALSIVYRLRIF